MRLAGICATFALALTSLALATPAHSASSKGCEGGGFTALGHSPDGRGYSEATTPLAPERLKLRRLSLAVP